MEQDAAIAPESLLADKYRVVRRIGQGGMGIVLEARHELLGTPAAIKIMSAAALVQEGATSRFLREARAAAGLRSEYVARVTDFGMLADGRPFMVMELLEGEDLADALQRGLPREEALDAFLQACAGLAEAHAAGIVHRDLKPSNLFRTRRPDGSFCTKILDFGISKLRKPDALPDATTKSSVMLGTPYYMSPEQVRSAKSVDARTDVWQMGVVLYQAMTGKRPFDGDNVGMLFAQILEVPAPPARQLVPDLPAGIEAVILACLEKEHARRLPTIAELANRLAPFAGPEGRLAAQRALAMAPAVSSTPAVPGATPAGASPTPAAPGTTPLFRTESAGGRALPARSDWTEAPVSRPANVAVHGRGGLLLGAAIAALALGGGAAAFLFGRSGATSPASTESALPEVSATNSPSALAAPAAPPSNSPEAEPESSVAVAHPEATASPSGARAATRPSHPPKPRPTATTPAPAGPPPTPTRPTLH